MAEKNGIVWNIFLDLEEAIDRTRSNTPVKICDSKFMREFEKIKKKYLNKGVS